MTIKQKIRELEDKLDLSKKYPDYINKIVFRVGFGVFMLFILYPILFYGINKEWVSIDCDSILGCPNPYIECSKDPFSEYCQYTQGKECKGWNCHKEIIPYNDYIGEKPPGIVKNSDLIIVLTIALIFLINHIVYKVRK